MKHSYVKLPEGKSSKNKIPPSGNLFPSRMVDFSSSLYEITRAMQWLEGSDTRSLWGIHFPYIFPLKWGAGWSYLEFPNHLIAGGYQGSGTNLHFGKSMKKCCGNIAQRPFYRMCATYTAGGFHRKWLLMLFEGQCFQKMQLQGRASNQTVLLSIENIIGTPCSEHEEYIVKCRWN